MTTLFANFLAGTTTDSPLTSGATTINSSGFTSLPDVSGGDIMWLVLDPDASAGAPEIVKVTSHGTSASNVTVVREQQSTTAREHASGTTWRAVVTKDDMDTLMGFLEDGAVDTANLADSAVTTAKLAAGSVTNAKMGADAVTGAEIADDSIDSEHYVDGSIDTAHIADGAVTTAKMTLSKVGVSASRSTSQSITTPWTTLEYTTEDYDSDGFFSPTSGTVTIPAGMGGLYAITSRWDKTGDSTQLTHRINAGGVVYESATGREIGAFTIVVPLDAADTISVELNGTETILASEIHVYKVS